MLNFPPTKPPLWLQALLIMLLIWTGVAVLFGRSGWEDWSQPRWLEGDPLEVYARVKIAAEQPLHALLSFTRIERLGAPVAADWSAYPVPDRLVFVLTGQLSRITGLMAAVHLAGAFIAGLNALSFYLCARWLRWRWEWAAALAAVFAFSCYNIRWGITLSFSQVFVLPPLVLLCARAARTGPVVGPRRGWLLLAVGLGSWLGLANPYLAYFAGVVTGGALLLSLARRGPGVRRLPLLVLLGCLLTSFTLGNIGAIAAQLQGSITQHRGRSTDDLSLYALRPVDWVVPPADHRIPAFAKLGRDYQAARRSSAEFFYNYLGVAGLSGLALLLIRGVTHLRRRRWHRLDPVLGLAWITLFGVAGGINTWVGAVSADVFRVSARIGIYALVWTLFATGTCLSRRTLGWPRPGSVLLALTLGLVAVWEQTPFLADRSGLVQNSDRWQAVADLTGRLERELPAGAQVFQLPVVPFPEAGVTGTMSDYEHFLPLLTSRSLHISYGQLHRSPWLRWARYVSRLPAADFIPALERAGYDLLWVDRRAYPDGAESLAGRLRAHGLAELPPPASALPVRIFRLQAAASPALPDLHDPRLNEAWNPAAPAPASLFVMEGWYASEQDEDRQWRWARQQALVGLWHDGPPASGSLRFRIDGPTGSVVVLRLHGQEVWRGSPGPTTRELHLPLASGLNSLQWDLIGRTFRPGGGDPRELGFMVENLSLSVP